MISVKNHLVSRTILKLSEKGILTLQYQNMELAFPTVEVICRSLETNFLTSIGWEIRSIWLLILLLEIYVTFSTFNTPFVSLRRVRNSLFVSEFNIITAVLLIFGENIEGIFKCFYC